MSVNLKKSFANLNEKMSKSFDDSGVRRNFTVPYVKGHDMGQHVQDVGKVAMQSGGIPNNFLTSYHHGTGKGWGSEDGETVGHPAHQLQNSVISKGNKSVEDAIEAAQTHLSNLAHVLGKDDPNIMASQHQLDLVKKTQGVGMTLFNLGTLLLQIMFRPTQAAARAHARQKTGGVSGRLQPPAQEQEASAEGQESPEGGQEEAQPAGVAQGGGAPAAPAQTAPAAQGEA